MSERTGAAERLTGRAGRVVGCIAGRAIASPGMVHWKRCGRVGRGEGSKSGEIALRYLAWRRGIGGGEAVDGLDAGGGFALSEPEVFQARVDRAHKEERTKREEKRKAKEKKKRWEETQSRKEGYEKDGGVWERKSRELVSSKVGRVGRQAGRQVPRYLGR